MWPSVACCVDVSLQGTLGTGVSGSLGTGHWGQVSLPSVPTAQGPGQISRAGVGKKETINRAFVLIYAGWHACPTPTREEGPSLWAAGSWRPMA